jgi:hypothetical protein
MPRDASAPASRHGKRWCPDALRQAFLSSVLFSAAYRHEAKFLKLWQMPDVNLVTSPYAAEEARRNLEKPEQRERLETLL